MKVPCLLVFLSLSWNLLSGLESSKSCTDDQYKRISQNSSAVCVDCISCPPGLGPSVECGSTVSTDTIIECRPCGAGVNFSSDYDFEQCQACSVCSKDQASKPCTPKSDTVCEKRCISKGKYYEKSSDDCQDCTWCCGDGDDRKIVECLRKGMPAQKSCTVHRRKLCKPPTSSAGPTTALSITARPPTTTGTKPNTEITKAYKNNHWHLREVKRGKPSNNSHFEGSNAQKSLSNNSTSTVTMDVFLGVICGLGSLFIIAVFILLLKKYHKRCISPRSNLRVIYSTVSLTEDKYSIINTCQDTSLFVLLENNHELKEVICDKLDCRGSFAKLARSCKVNEDQVKKLEQFPYSGSIGPTSQVFDLIKGDKPTFCFGEFANILKKIKRKDVLHCCIEKLTPSKEIQVSLGPA